MKSLTENSTEEFIFILLLMNKELRTIEDVLAFTKTSPLMSDVEYRITGLMRNQEKLSRVRHKIVSYRKENLI